MMRTLTELLLAQPSGGQSSNKCDMCGADTTYSEELLTGTLNGESVTKRTITANGCPNHYSVCTGKDGPPGCGDVGEEGTDTEATPQDHVIDIPAYPVIATENTTNECTLGISSIALNGVSIFNGAVNQQCELVDVDAEESEWTSFDFCSGHSQSSGDYHYHFPLTTQTYSSYA